MSERSPAPWKFSRVTIGHPDNAHNPMVTTPSYNIARMFCRQSTVAGMNSRGPCLEEAEANARLIAAAPDLLEACEAMLANFSLDLWRKAAAEHGRVAPLMECVESMTTAVAKAKGELP